MIHSRRVALQGISELDYAEELYGAVMASKNPEALAETTTVKGQSRSGKGNFGKRSLQPVIPIRAINSAEENASARERCRQFLAGSVDAVDWVELDG